MLNRLRRTEHPDGSEELFTPDAEGNRVVWERENNQRLEMDYDPPNRLIETRRVPAAGDGIARVNRIYDGNGNLTRVEEHPASGAPRLWIARYDDFNRRIEWTDRNGLTIRQRFDASDNRIERTGPEGSTTYTYNALDQLQGVTPPPAAAPTVATVSKAGRLLQLSHANGSRTEVTRDGAGRAVQLRHALGAAALLTLSYTLDANGHRVAETWERGSEVISIAYELDLAERLKAVTTEGQRIEYTLDENGNRTAEILPGGLTRSHAYDNRDRLITTTENGQPAATYAYGLAGRQITHTAAGVTRQFDYDTQDRLLGVTQNGTPLIRYEVDAFGQRTLRDAEGQVEQYQWDGTRLAGRTNATGTSLGDYQYAYGWAISSREGGIRSTLHTDVHGTPQLTTDPTAAIVGWTRTDVWGVEKANSGQQSRLGHTGYLKDPLLTDELYAQARQYRAGTGRFTSRDEWTGDNNNPITLNKYLYGIGNPGTFLDPDGREVWNAHFSALNARAANRDPSQEERLNREVAYQARQRDLGFAHGRGVAAGAAELVEGTLNFVGNVATAPIEGLTLGHVDMGSGRALHDGLVAIGSAIANPADTIANVRQQLSDTWTEIDDLRAAGREEEAEYISGKLHFNEATVVGGAPAAARSVVNFGRAAGRSVDNYVGKLDFDARDIDAQVYTDVAPRERLVIERQDGNSPEPQPRYLYRTIRDRQGRDDPNAANFPQVGSIGAVVPRGTSNDVKAHIDGAPEWSAFQCSQLKPEPVGRCC